MAISTEANELHSFLARMRERLPSCPPGELVRMLEWAEGRFKHLEGELTADGIAEALRDRKLFPEVEDLVVHNIEENA